MDPCDTIRNCIESITLNIERVCKEKADISKQLEETAEKLRGAEQFLPPATPPAVQKILTGASHTVAEIAKEMKGEGGLTKNFSKFKSNVGAVGNPTGKYVRPQFELGLGGASVPASSAGMSKVPTSGTWDEIMSKSKGKPYWRSKENPNITTWDQPTGSAVIMKGGRRRTRRAKKSRSKSRKSRR